MYVPLTEWKLWMKELNHAFLPFIGIHQLLPQLQQHSQQPGLLLLLFVLQLDLLIRLVVKYRIGISRAPRFYL